MGNAGVGQVISTALSSVVHLKQDNLIIVHHGKRTH